MARAAGVDLTLGDFRRIAAETPFIANLKPSGKYVMEDLHAVGGTPGVLKYMLEQGQLHGDCMTVAPTPTPTLSLTLSLTLPLPLALALALALALPRWTASS